jgi:hypothetical protein
MLLTPSQGELPPEWAWERFTIVDAGNGKYAFHNPSNNRFLRMSNSTVDGKGGEERVVHDLPPEECWRWERFVVVELTGVGLGEELTGSVAAFPSVPSTSIADKGVVDSIDKALKKGKRNGDGVNNDISLYVTFYLLT